MNLLAGLSGCGPAILIGGATAAKVVHDRRTAGTLVEDQAIEFKAHTEFLRARPNLGRSNISVTSYNNVVLLSGEVETPEVRQWAENVVRNIEKVRFVHNELIVAPASPWGSRSNDAWLTTKVKSSLIKVDGLSGFDPTRVKVTTERGIVYLFGLVTHQEGDAVTNIVSRLSGVQQVVKLFEYI
jgi:osmotically-inducible protein OsmY